MVLCALSVLSVLFLLQRNQTGSELGVNKGILVVAQQYCVDCKTIYGDLSKIIQNVMASRRELVKYDTHKGEGQSSSSSSRSPMSPPMTPQVGVSGGHSFGANAVLVN